MLTLILFNLLLTAIVVGALYITKKYAHTENAKRIAFLIAPVITLVCHYISFLRTVFMGGDAFSFLAKNPNLFMPAYPCNLVMWVAVLFAFLKDKRSRIAEFLGDYIFWFGLISALVGMFANEDFIRTQSIADFAILKSIIAHATLFFNILLLPIFGYVKIDVKKNFKNIVISVLVMGVTGAYCTLIFYALVSYEQAYFINSMFMMHSPFAGLNFLTYPMVALIAIPVYFVIFVLCDLCAHKKGERFYNRKKK